MRENKEKISSSLKKNILATLCYYKALEWPVTSFECYRYLIRKESGELDFDFSAVRDALAELYSEKRVNKKRGFYFLGEVSQEVPQRIKREKEALKKWLLAKKRIKVLRFLPYIRAVFVSGSVAVGNAHKDSDIDILVVAERGRVWTVRIMLHLILGVLGWRRHDQKIKNRLCLNHFLTTDNLKVPFESMYNAQTYAHLLCSMDTGGYFSLFVENNGWLAEYLLGGGGFEPIKKASCLYSEASRLQKFFELLMDNFLGNGLERLLGWLQKKRIGYRSARNSQDRVYIKNGQLAFHPQEKQRKIIEKYNKELEKRGLLKS